MPRTKVRSHIRKRGRKKFRVRRHTRSVKAKAVARITQIYPNISQKEAKHMFDTTIDSIKSDIKREGKASIPEFGTFRLKKVKARKARLGINPFTQEKIMIKAKPARRKLRFNPGKKFVI